MSHPISLSSCQIPALFLNAIALSFTVLENGGHFADLVNLRN